LIFLVARWKVLKWLLFKTLFGKRLKNHSLEGFEMASIYSVWFLNM